MSDQRASAWKQPPPIPDEVRCDALLWFARYPDRYRGDIRCRQVATFRVAGTETIVCALHAAPLRFGRSIDTVDGPIIGQTLEPLQATTIQGRSKSARVEELEGAPRFALPPSVFEDLPVASYANATREAFPDGLPPRPIGLEERRWTVVRRRWEGARLAEIATELNISRERAHQLERAALKVLLEQNKPDTAT